MIIRNITKQIFFMMSYPIGEGIKKIEADNILPPPPSRGRVREGDVISMSLY
jgi:hypothetical protein